MWNEAGKRSAKSGSSVQELALGGWPKWSFPERDSH
jgi:hypothetical protein